MASSSHQPLQVFVLLLKLTFTLLIIMLVASLKAFVEIAGYEFVWDEYVLANLVLMSQV
jgi:hypothetical protein